METNIIQEWIHQCEEFPDIINGLNEDELNHMISNIQQGLVVDVKNILGSLENEKHFVEDIKTKAYPNMKQEYHIGDKTYHTNNSSPEPRNGICLPHFLTFLNDYYVETRSHSYIINIHGEHVRAGVFYNNITLHDGKILCVLYIGDVYVDDGYRGKGIGKNIETIIQEIAKDNEVDLIVSHVSTEDNNMQNIMEKSKQKNGYHVIPGPGGGDCIKSFTEKGEKTKQYILDN